MRPPCIILVEEVLPDVRRTLAKELYGKGWTQESISSLLSVSQAMVSRYLKEPEVAPGTLTDFIEGMVRPLSAYAQQGATGEEMTRMFCSLCRHCLSAGMMDARYIERFPGSSPPHCHSGSLSDERGSAISELMAAARFLGTSPIPDLIPAVKINLARCLESAGSRDDVASFPGRLQDIMGSIRQMMPPQFGVSHHLADILLEAHAADGSVLSVANIRLNDDIRGTLSRIGVPVGDLERDAEGSVHGIGARVGEGFLALADPGDFGIEPCLYMFGGSSLEVASRLVEIGRSMEKR